jgi:hypothetical protein
MPNAAQRRAIFGAARQLGLDDEQLRDQVEGVSGGRSVSALTQPQTKELLDAFARAGARLGSNSQTKRKPRGRRTQPGETLLITGDQREMIEDMRRRLGGKWEEERYFEGACARVIKKPRPTTAGDGVRVIEMLKQRIAYEAKRRG